MRVDFPRTPTKRPTKVSTEVPTKCPLTWPGWTCPVFTCSLPRPSKYRAVGEGCSCGPWKRVNLSFWSFFFFERAQKGIHGKSIEKNTLKTLKNPETPWKYPENTLKTPWKILTKWHSVLFPYALCGCALCAFPSCSQFSRQFFRQIWPIWRQATSDNVIVCPKYYKNASKNGTSWTSA